ncbi:MAG: hypothetical protein U1F43_35565 [Myxococcota bacterium]
MIRRSATVSACLLLFACKGSAPAPDASPASSVATTAPAVTASPDAAGPAAPAAPDAGGLAAPTESDVTAAAPAAPDAAGASVSPDPGALAHDLTVLYDARLKVLLDELTSRPSAHDEAFAVGPCKRPDAARKDALRKKVDAWLAKLAPQKPGVSASIDLVYGCDDANVFARVERTESSESEPGETAKAWIVALGGDEVRVLQHDDAIESGSEWTARHALELLAMVDLDHDGVSDPVTMTESKDEGGSSSGTYDLFVPGPKGPTKLGSLTGAFDVALLQPAPSEGILVVTVSTPTEDEAKCISATALSDCPAAARALAHSAEFETLSSAKGAALVALDDRDSLADALVPLHLPDAERDALLARAAPSTAQQAIGRWWRGLAVPGDDVRLAAVAEAEATLRAALGDQACERPAGDIAAAIAAWIAKNDRAVLRAQEACQGKACAVTKPPVATLEGACAGPSGALVLATWIYEFPGGGTPFGFARAGLFFLAGDKVTKVMDAVAPLAQDGMGELMTNPETPLLRAKLHVRDGAVVALVVGTEGPPSAVVDAAVVGAGPQPGEFAWRWGGASMNVELDGDGLLRSEADGKATFWHASKDGVTAVASLAPPALTAAAPADGGPLVAALFVSEQRIAARAYLGTFTRPVDLGPAEARANTLAALALAGAPAELVATVRQRLPTP